MEQANSLVVPQVNVNDDTVLLVKWSVAQHAQVAAGDVVCEVETSKASAEVIADRSGVLVQSAVPPLRVGIGDTIGAIGTTREAAVAWLASAASAAAAAAAVAPAEAGGAVQATAKAKALAERHGVSLDAVAQSGVRGTIKESDVQRFLEWPAAPQTPSAAAPPPGLAGYLEHAGALPAFDAAVAANLRRSVAHLMLTSVDADCRVAQAQAVTQRALAAGRMVSLLHVMIAATGRVLPRFPRLMSVAFGDALYRYGAVDVAFIARTPEGRLYTPVVRGANRLDLDAVARACQAATLGVMRGTIKAEALEGACFTISHVAVGQTTRVAAIPSFGQSAILGVSAERTRVELVDGAAVERPIVTLTLSYDHAVCDGVYAAGFLAELIADLERPPA